MLHIKSEDQAPVIPKRVRNACEHSRRRDACVLCHGKGICEHKRRREVCADCGGSQMCEHRRRRERCVECKGSSICEHNRRRHKCSICSPVGYTLEKARRAVARALRMRGCIKDARTQTLLGCSPSEFYEYLQRKIAAWNAEFEEQIGLDTMACDHCKPLTAGGDLHELMHFTNMQPMPRWLNLFKSNKWSAVDDSDWRSNVLYHSHREQVFWPRACGGLSLPRKKTGCLVASTTTPVRVAFSDPESFQRGQLAPRTWLQPDASAASPGQGSENNLSCVELLQAS